jgi:hypothetical protein
MFTMRTFGPWLLGKDAKAIYEALSQRDVQALPMSSGLCTTRLTAKMAMSAWRSIPTWRTTPRDDC